MDLVALQTYIKDKLFTKTGKLNTAVIRQPAFKMSAEHEEILRLTHAMKPETSFAGRIYAVLKGFPVCEICNKRPLAYFNGFLKSCAHHNCTMHLITTKRLATLNRKWGAPVSPKTRESAKARVGDLNRKGRETLMKKYGVENSFQLPHVAKRRVEGLTAFQAAYDSEANRKKIWSERFDISIDKIVDLDSSYVHFSCKTCLRNDVKTFYTLVHRHKLAGTACGECGGFNSGSFEQAALYREVLKLASDAILNDRQQINPLELDIFIPSKHLAIEYHGVFWHSADTMEHDQLEHCKKRKLCEDRGITLLQFTSDVPREKILSRISHALGLSKKIPARKCSFDKIDSSKAKAVISEWHNSSVSISCKNAYGLFYQGELVQIASFGKPRFSSSHEVELYRLAAKPGVCVVGGVSKLITNALKDLKKSSLLTYSDRFLRGTGYEACGFRREGVSRPNYWYYHPRHDRLLSRYSAQKHMLKKLLGDAYNCKLTEKENMLSNGYRILYDAGNFKYSFSLPL